MVDFATLETLDEDTLRKLYIEEGYSRSELARLFGVSTRRIGQLLAEYNIPSHGRHYRSSHCKNNKQLNKGNLTYDYWKSGLTEEQIAQKYGTHRTTICRLMKKWGIPAKSAAEYTLPQRVNIATRRRAMTKVLLDEVLAVEGKEFQLTPEYITGLVDGEGSFSIGLDFRFNPPAAYCDFSLSNNHKETLCRIKDFFGFGSIVVENANKRGRPTYSFSVNSIRNQLKLAKFFLEYPLSIKAHAFKCWFRALQLIAKDEHRTERGFREIVFLKENINAH